MKGTTAQELQWFLLENFEFVKTHEPITLTFNKIEYVYTLKHEYVINDIRFVDRVYKDPLSGKVALTVGKTERLFYDSLSEFLDKASKFYFEKWQYGTRLLTFPITENDPSWETFEKTIPFLLNDLKKYNDWSLSLVRLGVTEEDSVPTIRVACPTIVNFKTEIPENLQLVQDQEKAYKFL